LHIGGVRTALYNYLFSKQKNGVFVLRIEDTDQNRYVEGAEDYILESLKWLGIEPAEGPDQGGEFGPYRQSERKELYKEYIAQLISNQSAYYAFDTPEEIEAMKVKKQAEGQHAPRYDHTVRLEMRNSLTLSPKEVVDLMAAGQPFTIRLKVDPGQEVSFDDVVRGHVTFKTDELDDKVLMKSDGWPTYHLANVIDDYLMKISHVIRGEEWLSSTPHHVLLYKAFGWTDNMPTFVHLPLILKPTGKGKLSKRDGAKFGFPVFPLNWEGEEPFDGFREQGFLPASVLNFLALLGWHPADETELFTLKEITEVFGLDRISKSGARFDFEKAKWFNHQYINSAPLGDIVSLVNGDMQARYGAIDSEKLNRIVDQMRPRVDLVNQIVDDSAIYFEMPDERDEKTAKKKWKEDSEAHLNDLISILSALPDFTPQSLENGVKDYIAGNELSFGAIFPILRIGLSGTVKGPDLFEVMSILGKDETCLRLTKAIDWFKTLS
jgi:glutamyl-tRNA synthetase